VPVSIDLVVGPPATIQVGSVVTVTPTIEVRGANGRPIRNIPITIAPAFNSGVLAGAPTLTLAGPTPVGTWTLGTSVGPQSLRIDSPDLPRLTITVQATSGAAATVTVIEGNQQSAAENTAVGLPIRVQVRDQYGNNIPSLTVAWSVAAGGGALAASTSVTDELGIATAPTWIVGAEGSGPQRLVATVAALTAEVTAAVQQPPAEITIETVVPATVLLGSTLSPSFLVRDADGNIVAGVPVTVIVTAGGGQLVNPPTESGALATSIGTWTVGSSFGTQTVTVSVAGIPSAVITTEAVSEYALEIRWRGAAPTGEVLTAFNNAVERIRTIVVGPQTSVTYANFNANNCVSGLTLNETIPGLLISAAIEPIDGPGGFWGFAGPCYLRAGNLLTVVGQMRFDSVDMPDILASGLLENLILHEMLHVVGVGTLWNTKGLQVGAAPGSPPFFMGALARAACLNEHAGAAFCSFGVPAEDCLNLGFTCGAGTINVHWKESVFRTELMTGFLNAGVNPFSRMTVQSLADLDYEVNVNAADPYTVPPPALFSPTAAPSIRMSNPHGPVAAVNANGQITRTFTPAPRDP
jgi:microcystin-dependent protein